MRTNRIILAAILALTVVSCSTEREDEVNPAAPAAAKLELKPIKKEKSNNQGNSTAKESDSTVIFQPTKAEPGTGIEPVEPTNPNGPGEVVDPTKPDKPW